MKSQDYSRFWLLSYSTVPVLLKFCRTAALAAIMSPLLPAAQFVRQIFKHPAWPACYLSHAYYSWSEVPKFKCCFSR